MHKQNGLLSCSVELGRHVGCALWNLRKVGRHATSVSRGGDDFRQAGVKLVRRLEIVPSPQIFARSGLKMMSRFDVRVLERSPSTRASEGLTDHGKRSAQAGKADAGKAGGESRTGCCSACVPTIHAAKCGGPPGDMVATIHGRWRGGQNWRTTLSNLDARERRMLNWLRHPSFSPCVAVTHARTRQSVPALPNLAVSGSQHAHTLPLSHTRVEIDALPSSIS